MVLQFYKQYYAFLLLLRGINKSNNATIT